jgi:hypothetical protein
VQSSHFIQLSLHSDLLKLTKNNSYMKIIYNFVTGFLEDLFARHTIHQKYIQDYIHAEKRLRRKLSEKEIDKMIADSFPASDPPSTY